MTEEATEIPPETLKYLDRGYTLLEENNMINIKKKLHAPELKLDRDTNSKRTLISNFVDICTQFNRDPKKSAQFFGDELSAQWTFKKNNQGYDVYVLYMACSQKNRSAIMDTYRRFIEKYIRCNQCHHSCTEIIKIKGAKCDYLQCNACNSRNPIN